MNEDQTKCEECDGTGRVTKYRKIDGHFEGGEYLNECCDWCEGTGFIAAARDISPHKYAYRARNPHTKEWSDVWVPCSPEAASKAKELGYMIRYEDGIGICD